MAKSVLDIVIRTLKEGGADKDTVKGLVALKSSIMQATAVAGAFVAAGFAIKQVLDQTVGVAVKYADEIRRLSNATGMGAEEASRTVQVLDDLKISYDDLEKAVAKNGKTFDYSIEGLARMSDEYLGLRSSQEQAAFMQERFGKNWITFTPAMKMGSQALRDANAAVNENLIMTQKSLDQARQYEIAVDNLSDSWQGFQIAAGTKALPALNTLLVAMQKHVDVGMTWRNAVAPIALYDWVVSLSDANKELSSAVDTTTGSVENQNSALEQNALDIKAISQANQELLGMIGSMQSAQDSYSEKYKTIAADMSLTDDQRKAKLDELAIQYDLDTKKIVLNMLQQKLAQDGLTNDELNYLLTKGQAWGIYSATVVNEAQKAMQEVNGLASDINSIPTEKTVTITVQQLGGYDIGTSGYNHVAHPGRAAGGPVSAGRTYVVGERGPELFVPNQSGMIVPNGGGGGGNVTVMVNISSPVTIADEQSARNVLAPYIVNGIKEAKARGQL